MKRPYPEAGREGTLRILDGAGYVEYAEFEDQEKGYFCRTCTKMADDMVQAPGGFVGYLCRGLGVPVAPHGCCNYWVYLPPSKRLSL